MRAGLRGLESEVNSWLAKFASGAQILDKHTAACTVADTADGEYFQLVVITICMWNSPAVLLNPGTPFWSKKLRLPDYSVASAKAIRNPDRHRGYYRNSAFRGSSKRGGGPIVITATSTTTAGPAIRGERYRESNYYYR